MDSKAGHGKDFKEQVLDCFIDLHESKIINCVETGKRFSFKQDFKPQFFAPYLITIDNNKFVFFTTTSVRSDRIKINQWDAWGLKQCNQEIKKCFIVIPSELSEKEEKIFQIEFKKLTNIHFFNAIDGIIRLDELKKFIENIK